MVKKYLFIALFMGIAFGGFSQFETKGFIGINASSLTNVGEGYTQKADIGYQLGASILFGTTWYVEPGIVWAVTSQIIEEESGTNPSSITNKISGLKVPLLVGYRFFGRTQNLLNLRLFIGVDANFVTDVKLDEVSIDKEFYNSVMWSGDVGVGLDVWFLFLDIGYGFGLTELFVGENFLSTKVNTFYVNVGGRIKFGNKSRGRSKK